LLPRWSWRGLGVTNVGQVIQTVGSSRFNGSKFEIHRNLIAVFREQNHEQFIE
jgi:hypothetical protein